MILQPGTPAPAFTLHSTPDQTVSLTDFRGQPLILAFYPADWSPVCGDQMTLYNEILPEFRQHNAALLGDLGRRCLVPRCICRRPQSAFSASGRLRAEGRGGQDVMVPIGPRKASPSGRSS